VAGITAMNAHQRRIDKRLYERAFGNHVCYYVEIPITVEGRMIHNRQPDDEYAKDVEEARRLVTLSESIHNGKIREERGEAWYGSEAMLEWDRAITTDMGILLARILAYADSQHARVLVLEKYAETLEEAFSIATELKP
jgi:hypothetical protein